MPILNPEAFTWMQGGSTNTYTGAGASVDLLGIRLTSQLRRPLIPYVRQRMAERGITEAQLDWALVNYHTRQPAQPRRGSRPAEILVATYQGRELKVWVERDVDPFFVKSVAWKD